MLLDTRIAVTCVALEFHVDNLPTEQQWRRLRETFRMAEADLHYDIFKGEEQISSGKVFADEKGFRTLKEIVENPTPTQSNGPDERSGEISGQEVVG
jgi:hypothetical protein